MVQLVAGWALGGWYVVITTDFSMENYKEFLTDALPHLDQMVVIEIDSASFTWSGGDLALKTNIWNDCIYRVYINIYCILYIVTKKERYPITTNEHNYRKIAKLISRSLSSNVQCVSAATKRWKWWNRCGERSDFPFADREFGMYVWRFVSHVGRWPFNRFFWTYTALHAPIRASQKEPLRNTKFFFVDSTQKKGNHPKQQDNPAPKNSNRAPKTADISNTNNTSSILKCHRPPLIIPPFSLLRLWWTFSSP